MTLDSILTTMDSLLFIGCIGGTIGTICLAIIDKVFPNDKEHL